MITTNDTPTDPSGPWHRLARFRDDLDTAHSLAAQITATLRAARSECRADAAVWHGGSKSETVLVDAAEVDANWAGEVARLALAGTGPEASVGTWVPVDPPLSLHPSPTAAAFARLRPLRLGALVVV